MKYTLSVVVPVFNNEGSLFPLYERLVNVESDLKKRSVALQLVFVDDGSQDSSYEKLVKIKAVNNDVRIIKLTRNFGVIHADKKALEYVQGDCFMFLAADLQDPPELILPMVDAWINGSKFIICEREGREDPFLSKVYSKFYYWLLRILVMSNYPVGGYDLALMDKLFIPHILSSSKTVYTPLLAYWLGFKPHSIKYKRQKRYHGKSQWTFRKKFKAFINVILGFSATPMRLLSFFGFVVAVISFSYGVLIVSSAIMGQIPVPGFATLVALISFLGGIVIVMLGLIGEYIWRIYEELNGRPESIVEKIL